MIQDRIRDVLAAHGRMAVDPREVDGQADLYELGLTSLGRLMSCLRLRMHSTSSSPMKCSRSPPSLPYATSSR